MTSVSGGGSEDPIKVIIPSAGDKINFSSFGTILSGSRKKYAIKINKKRRQIPTNGKNA